MSLGGPWSPADPISMVNNSQISSFSDATVATSSVSILSSPHGRQRRLERNIAKRDLQAAVKYGSKEPGIPNRRTGDPTWKYTFGDIVYVTDATSRREITSWPVPGVGIDIEEKAITLEMRREHEEEMRKIRNSPAYWTSHTVGSCIVCIYACMSVKMHYALYFFSFNFQNQN